MKMFPVSHKLIITTQFFQDHGHSPQSDTLPGHEESPQRFFEFFLAIILLEIIAIVCEKQRYFLEI